MLEYRNMTPFEYLRANWGKVKTYVCWFLCVAAIAITPLLLSIWRWGDNEQLSAAGIFCVIFSLMWIFGAIIGGIAIAIVSSDNRVYEDE